MCVCEFYSQNKEWKSFTIKRKKNLHLLRQLNQTSLAINQQKKNHQNFLQSPSSSNQWIQKTKKKFALQKVFINTEKKIWANLPPPSIGKFEFGWNWWKIYLYLYFFFSFSFELIVYLFLNENLPIGFQYFFFLSLSLIENQIN